VRFQLKKCHHVLDHFYHLCVVEQVVEIVREVPVEKVVERIQIKEIPVVETEERVVEVVREIPVEIIREVPVYIKVCEL
jgi:hypothetical protein